MPGRQPHRAQTKEVVKRMATVHGVNLSPYVRKVRIALREKGIAYELNPVIPMNVSADFKKISPLGKIPVYSPREGVDIPDSSVIIAYLERVQPKPALYPEKAEDMARALFLEEYVDGAFIPAGGTVFFQRFVRPRLLGEATDEALVNTALTETMPPMLAYLNEQLGGREFLVGKSLTVADIATVSPFVNLLHVGEKVDAGRYPHLAGYLTRLFERPSIKELITEEQQAYSVAA